MFIRDVVTSTVLTFASLFPIVNPLEDVPLFASITTHLNDAERRKIVVSVTVNSALLLTGSLLLGPLLLRFFGLDLSAVRIAGGLIVVAVAWRLFNSEASTAEPPKEDGAKPGQSPLTSTFYPLTMPLTVGPGSISVSIALGSAGAKHLDELATALASYIGGMIGIMGIAAAIFVCYRYANVVLEKLGATAVEVVMRLSAFILMCVGVQIVWQGYKGLASF